MKFLSMLHFPLSSLLCVLCASVFPNFESQKEHRRENFIEKISPQQSSQEIHEVAWTHAGLIKKEEWISLQIENFDCHSSSLVETIPGKYCVVWKGGAGKGKSNLDMHQHVGIWMSSFDSQWSEPIEIVSPSGGVCWTPVLCQNPSQGELFLFYRIGTSPRSAVSVLQRSVDQGKYWSVKEILPAGIVGPTKGRPLFSAEGKILLVPSSVEVGNPEDSIKATACWVEMSDDSGYTWQKIGPIELEHQKFGVIEPVFFYDKDHHLRMLCRDRAYRIGETGYIWKAISKDNGLHWSCLERTSLPNPDSAFDVVDLGQGKLVLVYNHSNTQRYPLHLAVSLDGGDTWSQPVLLDEKGEFPSAILGSDGLIHVTYAREKPDGTGQRGIKHAVVDAEKLFLRLSNQEKN